MVAVNAGLKVVAKRQTMSVAPATTFTQLVTLAIRDKEVSKSYDRAPSNLDSEGCAHVYLGLCQAPPPLCVVLGLCICRNSHRLSCAHV